MPRWMHVSIEGARRVLIRAFKEDPGILKGYVDNAAVAIRQVYPGANDNESAKIALAVLERLFNPRELTPLKFELGKYYRHKSISPVVIFHVVARANTTGYGNTLIAETPNGLKCVGSDETSAKNFEEVPREEWEMYWPEVSS